MMGRNRRSPAVRRGSNLKARLGIATAVVVGGGAIGAAAVATISHPSVPAAAAAGYSQSYGWSNSYNRQANYLSYGLSDYGWSHSRAFSNFAHLTNTGRETDLRRGRTTFAFERGTVVLATPRFVVIRAANGQFNVWFLSGGTHVTSVATSMAGTTAMTGSSWAASQAMNGSMTPMTNILTGSTTAAQRVLAPTATTVSVHIYGTNITVSVKVTANTATVQQGTTWWRQNAMMMTHGLQRGQLVFIAGTRTWYKLQAKVILIEKNPMMTTTPTPAPTTSPSTPATTTGNTGTGTVGGTGYNSGGGFNGGTHS
jgi:hypothetical protein